MMLVEQHFDIGGQRRGAFPKRREMRGALVRRLFEHPIELGIRQEPSPGLGRCHRFTPDDVPGNP
jgi:hypothetical protein